MIAPLSTNQLFLQLLPSSSTVSSIDGASFGAANPGNPPISAPTSPSATALQWMQGMAGSVNYLVDGIGFSNPSTNTLSNFIASSQQTVGTLFDQYA